VSLHAAIRDDGKFVATASADRTVRVWNVEQPPAKGMAANGFELRSACSQDALDKKNRLE
jgi:WD40 repeat protein